MNDTEVSAASAKRGRGGDESDDESWTNESNDEQLRSKHRRKTSASKDAKASVGSKGALQQIDEIPCDGASEWPDLPMGDVGEGEYGNTPATAPTDEEVGAMNEDTLTEEEGEEEESPAPGPVEEEKWDLRHVFGPAEIKARAAVCMGMDGECDNMACSRYVSSLDEDDVWDTCVDCQKE